MCSVLRLRLVLAACGATLLLATLTGAAEEAATAPAEASSSSSHPALPPDPASALTSDDDWEYLQRFYEPEKRAYSYVSEFKRLPVYNFGLGKRGGDSRSMYAFGLGKRGPGRQYSFGLGKRPSQSLYSFGLGKRSELPEEDPEEDPEEEEGEEEEGWEGWEDEDIDEEKRGRQYSFGLGKRGNQRAYSFGLGKRGGTQRAYSFGLGKRAPNRQYSFGLGKRLPNRQYSFGLGKREVDPLEAAQVALEAKSGPASSTTTNGPLTRRRRSVESVAPSGEHAEWADAEVPRDDTRSAQEQLEGFGRAGRRTYSFGLGKRLPRLYNFGVGKRQPFPLP